MVVTVHEEAGGRWTARLYERMPGGGARLLVVIRGSKSYVTRASHDAQRELARLRRVEPAHLFPHRGQLPDPVERVPVPAE